MNNLLNLVTDPSTASSSLLSASLVPTPLFGIFPKRGVGTRLAISRNLIDRLRALQKSAQYQLSTFLSIIRQFHEHN